MSRHAREEGKATGIREGQAHDRGRLDTMADVTSIVLEAPHYSFSVLSVLRVPCAFESPRTPDRVIVNAVHHSRHRQRPC